MDPLTIALSTVGPATLVGLALAIPTRAWRKLDTETRDAPNGDAAGAEGASQPAPESTETSEPNHDRAGTAWTAPAFALGDIAAVLLILGTPIAFPPTDVAFWPLALAPVFALLGVLEARRIGPAALRLALPLLAGLGAGFLLARGNALWSTGMLATVTPGLAFAMALTSFSTARLGDRRPGPGLPATLALIVLVASGCAGLSGSAKLAQLLGTLCAMLVALAVVLWRRPDLRPLPAIAPLFGLLHVWFLGRAWIFSEQSLVATLALAAAPAALWAGELPRLRDTARRSLAARLVALSLLAGIAIKICYAEFSAVSEYGY